MRLKLNNKGFSVIELFLSLIALFLLFIVTYPILLQLIAQSEIIKIKDNLSQIRSCANQYFERNPTSSVSLYEFIGPRKAIGELKIVADEEYQEIILRNEEISAYSTKHGTITIQIGQP